MNFEVIDYSEEYYKLILMKEIPPNRGGKFIQIINENTGKEYIVFSPAGLSFYHANIAERFFKLTAGIEGTYNPKRDLFHVNNPDWAITGGGLWSIDTTYKILNLSGTSRGYGKFNSYGLKQKILSLYKMNEFKVRIDGI